MPIFNLILLPLLTSLIIGWLIVHFADKIDWLIHKGDLQGVQKFHVDHTPSIGGIPVFLGFAVGLWLFDGRASGLWILWLASLPVFAGGVYEDLTARVSPLLRLLFAFVSIFILAIFMNLGIFSLGFEWIDGFLSSYWLIGLLFTLLVVGGAINSLNIIDGFNGLMAGYAILASFALAFVAYTLGDNLILQLSLLLSSSLVGFLILNFPFGKIFMGDGGAYFVGFILASIGLWLVDRHAELSNWFVLLIFIYPMYEVLFSIYRKKIVRGTSPSQPDGYHLHMLVYKRLVNCKRFKHNKTICNSMTSPFLWVLSLVGIIPAVIWYDDQTMLIIWAFVFMAIYTIIYRRIVHFRFKFKK